MWCVAVIYLDIVIVIIVVISIITIKITMATTKKNYIHSYSSWIPIPLYEYIVQHELQTKIGFC